MSDYQEVAYVDEFGNPVDPSEIGEYDEVIEEVGEYDGDALDVLDLDYETEVEVPDAPLDGGESRTRAHISEVVDSDEPIGAVDAGFDQPVSLGKARQAVPDDVEIADVQAAPPSSLNGKGKFVLVGAAVAALVVVGGLAYGMSAIGNQNTVEDIKAGAQSQYADASSAAVSKSSEVRGEVSEAVIDTCRVGKLSAGGGLGDAMADGTEQPKLKLDVVSSTPLPGPFIAARTNADGVEGNPSLLQLTKSGWGVYTTVPLTSAEKKQKIDRPGYHKADVTVTDDAVRVTGDRAWAGGDVGGAGSCEPGSPGVYAATGRVPADASGLVDGRAQVDAIQGVAGRRDTAVAVMGDSIVLVKLVENTSEGGEAGESRKPSK